MSPIALTPSPDHRPAVAAARRERMRGHLLEAALRTVISHDSVQVPLDALLLQAEVSKGTFYKYFPDVLAVVQAMASSLSDELIAALHPLVGTIEDPAERLATGMLGVLAFVQRAPLLGVLVTHTGWPQVQPDASHAFHRLVGPNLAHGQKVGRFARMDQSLAMGLLATHVVATAHCLGHSSEPAALVQQSVAALLRCMGVAPSDALRLAQRRLDLSGIQPGPLLRLAAASGIQP